VPPAPACLFGGNYGGKYDGGDYGTIHVTVDGNTGLVSGQGHSAKTGAVFGIGGVVAANGAMATNGNVTSGAVSSGYASGQWAA
jgi:hypothetical protein